MALVVGFVMQQGHPMKLHVSSNPRGTFSSPVVPAGRGTGTEAGGAPVGTRGSRAQSTRTPRPAPPREGFRKRCPGAD